MTLQSRLFAIIIAIVLLPLLAASLLGRGIVTRELERRAYVQVGQGAGTASILYGLQARNSRDRAEVIATDPEFQRLLLANKFDELTTFLKARLGESADLIDFAVVADTSGKALASALNNPDFLPFFKPPDAAAIGAPGDTTSRGVLIAAVPISSPDGKKTIANVIAGEYLDIPFARRLAESSDVDASILIGEVAVASTIASARHSEGPIRIGLNRREGFATKIAAEPVYAIPVQLATGVPITQFALLISTSQDPVANVTSGLTGLLLLVLLVAILFAASLAYLLVLGITRPIRELVGGADAIASGDYRTHIQVRSRDEVGQLAMAFNEMAVRLSENFDELRESREKQQRALTRFGQLLRATHDLDLLLNEVVETSIDHLRARSGMVMLVDHGARELRVSVARGLDLADLRLKVGEGLAGYVAESGNPIRLPNGAGNPARPVLGEPGFRTAMIAPIFAQEKITGVLSLFDKEEGLNFTETDLANLLSLADQAGVAIENVLLHDEAQRLSIVDGLTSTWNLRYFKMQMGREIERSARFKKPFSIIYFDIDDFKTVNDTYGHLRGDSVLIELVSRVRFTIREVDLLARHGGEEFIVILPETDASGGILAAEKIRAVVSDNPFEGDPPLNITVSLGVACYPSHGNDRESLVAAADWAMYRAKAAGKNRVVLYSPEDGPDRRNDK